MSAWEPHPHLVDRPSIVLVVVDMQEPFLRGIYERDRVVGNVKRLIQGAVILGVPIISTVQNSAAMGGIIPDILELLPDAPPIEKMTFSCYADPAFARAIDSTGRKQAALCGVESHICVSQTALDLMAAGYQAHVCVDAVSSRTEANWRLGVEKVRQAGGLINATESVLFELLQTAATPEFREILKLVK